MPWPSTCRRRRGVRRRRQVTYRRLDAAVSEAVAGRLAVGTSTASDGRNRRSARLAWPWSRRNSECCAPAAAFTCLDPAFPEGQVRELLDDAAPAAIVVDTASAGAWPG